MSAGATRLYFAFGSNLHVARMAARVPSARTVAIGRLADHRLAFRKRGADGSSKCDVVPTRAATVWGALYCIDAAEQSRLDAAEGAGYREVPVRIATEAGDLDAFTYRAHPERLTAAAPYAWYRQLVVDGACEHGLPAEYIAAIEAVAAMGDPPSNVAQGAGPI